MILARSPLAALASAILLAAPLAAFGQSQALPAHVHGQVQLDIVVDGPTIVIDMRSPLDNFLGFERAPRNDAERKAVDDAVAQLRAADRFIQIDPVASCKLGPVTLESAALGLGKDEAGAPEGHADLDGSFAFNCTNAVAAKFIDVDLFTPFKNVRQVDAQIASPQGQFKRSLKRPATRLAWAK